jgi:hypothetical protein
MKGKVTQASTNCVPGPDGYRCKITGADQAVHGEVEDGKGHQRHTQDDRQTIFIQRFPQLEPYYGGRDDREADRHHRGGDGNAESVKPYSSEGTIAVAEQPNR